MQPGSDDTAEENEETADNRQRVPTADEIKALMSRIEQGNVTARDVADRFETDENGNEWAVINGQRVSPDAVITGAAVPVDSNGQPAGQPVYEMVMAEGATGNQYTGGSGDPMAGVEGVFGSDYQGKIDSTDYRTFQELYPEFDFNDGNPRTTAKVRAYLEELGIQFNEQQLDEIVNTIAYRAQNIPATEYNYDFEMLRYGVIYEFLSNQGDPLNSYNPFETNYNNDVDFSIDTSEVFADHNNTSIPQVPNKEEQNTNTSTQNNSGNTGNNPNSQPTSNTQTTNTPTTGTSTQIPNPPNDGNVDASSTDVTEAFGDRNNTSIPQVPNEEEQNTNTSTQNNSGNTGNNPNSQPTSNTQTTNTPTTSTPTQTLDPSNNGNVDTSPKTRETGNIRAEDNDKPDPQNSTVVNQNNQETTTNSGNSNQTTPVMPNQNNNTGNQSTIPQNNWDSDEAQQNLIDGYISRLRDKIGMPYVLGGGNIPSYNGRSTRDENGNYRGFDCCGGVMQSLREATSLYIPPMNQHEILLQPWVEKTDTLSDGVLIFFDYDRNNQMDHIMTYYTGGGTNNVITTIGNEPGGRTTDQQRIENWRSWYPNANIIYGKINWETLRRTYQR